MVAAAPSHSTPPRSFAEIVSGNMHCGIPTSPRGLSKSFSEVVEKGGIIPVRKPGLYRGEPAVLFSKEEISKLASPFRFTLIGRFPYKRPPMEIIRKFFTSLGLKSLKSVGLMQDNHIVIFINLEEDYSRLLLRSTWYVSGSPLKIFKWSPDFFPSYESPVVPVWVAFPGLPLHFFDKTALFSIASVFGTPLKLDEPTANLSRPTVARLCIDIDVSKEKFNRLWLGDDKNGFWQDVIYENPQDYCVFCKKLGHTEAGCFIKNPELKVEKAKKAENVKSVRVKDNGASTKEVPAMSKEALINEVQSGPKNFLNVSDNTEGWQVIKNRKWKQKQAVSNSGDFQVTVPLKKGFVLKENVQSDSILHNETVTNSSIPNQSAENSRQPEIVATQHQNHSVLTSIAYGNLQQLTKENRVSSDLGISAGRASRQELIGGNASLVPAQNSLSSVISEKKMDLQLIVGNGEAAFDETALYNVRPSEVSSVFKKAACVDNLFCKPLDYSALQVQPLISLHGGPHTVVDGEKTSLQLVENSLIQPSFSTSNPSSGSHGFVSGVNVRDTGVSNSHSQIGVSNLGNLQPSISCKYKCQIIYGK